MKISRFYLLTLMFIICLLGYLTYKIIYPFLAAIAWATVFSIVFYPVYAFITKHIRIKSVASTLTVVLILIVLFGPISYLSFMLADELKGIIDMINQGSFDELKGIYERVQTTVIFKKIVAYIGEKNLPSEEMIIESLKHIGRKLIANISIQVTNIISFAVNFIFMIFTIFFMLKDGADFIYRAKEYLPFSENQKVRLATQVKDMVVSTVYGGVVVAIIQGLLGGIAFYIIGIHAPVLWGIAMSVMSFVPMIGTFAIWGPAVFYLILKGSYISGIGLLLYGIFIISMVDNILKPLIIGSRTKLPTVLIFFSVLGGINLFGMIGLIMGPLIMALFISVIDIFRHLEDEEASRGDAAV